MNKRIYIGVAAMALIAITALVVASLANGATSAHRENVPDPPLTTVLSINSDKLVTKGLERIRFMLMARSATNMPVPGVKVYLRVYTHGGVHFMIGLSRNLGPNETFDRVKSVHNEWVWSMQSAPASTGPAARLPLQIFLSPLQDGQRFSFTSWGRTVEGTKPTPADSFIAGTA